MNFRGFLFAVSSLCSFAFTGSRGKTTGRKLSLGDGIGNRRDAIIKQKIEEMSEDPELEAALTYPHFQSKTLFPSNHPEWALLCWDDCPPGKHINVKEKLMKEVKRYKAQKSIDDDTEYITEKLGKRRQKADEELEGSEPEEEPAKPAKRKKNSRSSKRKLGEMRRKEILRKNRRVEMKENAKKHSADVDQKIATLPFITRRIDFGPGGIQMGRPPKPESPSKPASRPKSTSRSLDPYRQEYNEDFGTSEPIRPQKRPPRPCPNIAYRLLKARPNSRLRGTRRAHMH